MKKILVTGSNGFVGSHICETLLESGYSVRAMVRQTSNLSNLRGLEVELAYGDLNDFDSLLKAVEGVSGIVNNGGLTKAIDPDMFYKVNAEGTANILEAACKANPNLEEFVQVSSAAAAGPSDSKIPLTENCPPRPLTVYGKSKLQGETAALNFKDRLPVVILRPSAIYGPRDDEMLSLFKIIKFGIKPVFGFSESFINFTFVKDFALAVVKSLETKPKSGEIYFITEKKSYSYRQACDIISEVMGKKAVTIHIPVSMLKFAGWISEKIARKRKKAAIFTRDKAAEFSQKYWLMAADKIEHDIGFAALTAFRDGAEKTVNWYREHGWL